MPWNGADRAKYDVIRARYSSDLSDAEFALILALLPARKRRGRKPTCAGEILNALFYLIRAGWAPSTCRATGAIRPRARRQDYTALRSSAISRHAIIASERSAR